MRHNHPRSVNHWPSPPGWHNIFTLVRFCCSALSSASATSCMEALAKKSPSIPPWEASISPQAFSNCSGDAHRSPDSDSRHPTCRRKGSNSFIWFISFRLQMSMRLAASFTWSMPQNAPRRPKPSWKRSASTPLVATSTKRPASKLRRRFAWTWEVRRWRSTASSPALARKDLVLLHKVQV